MSYINQTPKSVQKWKDELTLTHGLNVETNTIFDTVFKITKDSKLLWFQYRINHRILGTHLLLSKMNIRQDNRCTFCKTFPESILHLFWDCPYIKQFWTQLRNYIINQCNIHLNDWSVTLILFGNQSMDKVLNIILLQAKLFIYSNKMKEQKPSMEHFKKRISFFYHIDKYVSMKNMQTNDFEADWEQYRDLIQY
jgi:hypothetical protein